MLCKQIFVRVHVGGAAFVNHTINVGDPHILARKAQLDEQLEAGQGRSTCARHHKLHFIQFFTDYFKTIQNGCAHYNRSAVLVIVKYRNIHAPAQGTLYLETVWCLDVFKVDAAECGLQRCNDLDQLVGVVLVDFNVEHINTGKLLEQHCLAFHHGFGSQGADVAQTEHCCTVGNHTHQVCLGGVTHRIEGVCLDFFAGCCNTWRIGQCQVTLVDQAFCRRNLQFPRLWKFMIFKGGLPEALIHWLSHIIFSLR